MSRQLPPLNALRAFEAAGRHESFSRAAEELRVSHSSISRHVRGLEDRLNAQLFRDLPRGLALTSAGAAFLERISPAFDVIAEAAEVLTETPEGTVLINTEPLFATKWLIPHLSEFAELYPEIEIRIEATTALADIDRYEADLAVRYRQVPTPEPNASLISNGPIRAYAHPDLVASSIKEPRDLLNLPLYRDRAEQTWLRWFELAGGVAPEEVPLSAWRLSYVLAYEMALTGLGVILTTEDHAEFDVARGRLARVFDVSWQQGEMRLLHAELALRRRPVRVFQEWLLAKSAELRSVPN